MFQGGECLSLGHLLRTWPPAISVKTTLRFSHRSETSVCGTLCPLVYIHREKKMALDFIQALWNNGQHACATCASRLHSFTFLKLFLNAGITPATLVKENGSHARFMGVYCFYTSRLLNIYRSVSFTDIREYVYYNKCLVHTVLHGGIEQYKFTRLWKTPARIFIIATLSIHQPSSL
jgi:hypothetical protein